METFATRLQHAVAFLAFALVAPVALAQSSYAGMKGVDSAPTVFDFRIGDPKVALSHLELMQSMRQNPAMKSDGQAPEMVVVFIGPSVDLISTEGKADAQGRKALAEKIAAMDDRGVRFEVCMTSAEAMGLSPQSIVPEVVKVGNGWISLAGYQQKGYSMVADF